MKKVLKVILMIVVLGGGLLTLSGCSKQKTYTIERSDDSAKVTFKFPEDSGYKFTQTKKYNKANLKHPDNLSEIEFRLYYDYTNSSVITKNEKSFYSKSYKDFKNIEVGDYKGWSIWNRASLRSTYEMQLILTEPDAKNKVYAVNIRVMQSPLTQGQNFDIDKFVESKDFNRMLKSIKIEVAEDKK